MRCAGRERICPEDRVPVLGAGRSRSRRSLRLRADSISRDAPRLVAELLRIRQILEAAEPGEDELRARHAFHQLLNESVEE